MRGKTLVLAAACAAALGQADARAGVPLDGRDCFTPLVGGSPPTTIYGDLSNGGPDGVPDVGQCVCDWDRNGSVVPADVAAYVLSWFNAIINVDLHADVDCNGVVEPADVAAFIVIWSLGNQGGAPAATVGC